MFITNPKIKSLQKELTEHPIYNSINTLVELQCFLENHIYSVWDFMSVLKYIQHYIAPSNYPWIPKNSGKLRRFINEIVLEEESDTTSFNDKYLSHFEIYQYAMTEIGADINQSNEFIKIVENRGINYALQYSEIPKAAKKFIESTFEIINKDKLHLVVSSFTFGRETIIPEMFKSILNQIGLTENQCPTFYYYINRHIEVDDGKHGPLAMNLLENVCKHNQTYYNEALEIAQISLQARIDFWDNILESINMLNCSTSV